MNHEDKIAAHLLQFEDAIYEWDYAVQYRNGFSKKLLVVLETDKYGGYTFSFAVEVNGKEVDRTQALTAAIRIYNEVNNEQ